MKKILILIVLLVAIVLVWKFGLSKKMTETPAQNETADTTSIAGAVKNAEGQYEYKKETAYYTIEVTYPGSISLSGEARAKTRKTMDDFILASVSEFETMTTEFLIPEEKERLVTMGRKYAFGMEFTEYVSTNYISYKVLRYEDTGGAHPNTYYNGVAFTKAGDRVMLADLFKLDARYLDRLSAESYKQVTAELQKRSEGELSEDALDWIRMGTAPSPEAIQFFYVDANNNLTIIFPPYQVAAYAYGAFEVKIPLASLADILK